MISVLGMGKVSVCKWLLPLPGLLAVLVLQQKAWDQTCAFCRHSRLVGRERVESQQGYSKGKGRMTNESLTVLMFSICNLFLGLGG